MSIFTYSWHTSKFLLKRCQKHQTNIPRLGETGVQGGTHPPCPATCDLISSHPCRRWTQGVHLSQSGDGRAWRWRVGTGQPAVKFTGKPTGHLAPMLHRNVQRKFCGARYGSYNFTSTGSSRKNQRPCQLICLTDVSGLPSGKKPIED